MGWVINSDESLFESLHSPLFFTHVSVEEFQSFFLPIKYRELRRFREKTFLAHDNLFWGFFRVKNWIFRRNLHSFSRHFHRNFVFSNLFLSPSWSFRFFLVRFRQGLIKGSTHRFGFHFYWRGPFRGFEISTRWSRSQSNTVLESQNFPVRLWNGPIGSDAEIAGMKCYNYKSV